MLKNYKLIKDFILKLEFYRDCHFGVSLKALDLARTALSNPYLRDLKKETYFNFYNGLFIYFSSWSESITWEVIRAYEGKVSKYLLDVISTIDLAIYKPFKVGEESYCEGFYDFKEDIERIINNIKLKSKELKN